ncbi:MAG: dTDP-4-dehydrorhamnose 3,5-epimerase [Atopobiaceae bacterium]|nr:dTDP-4-dehydrorhamnose 3,5-epimerase [Atopobiaceae bacterium]
MSCGICNTSRIGGLVASITSGNFTFTPTSIDGVIVVDCKSYGDARGSFMETYKRPDFVAGGIDVEFVQDNQSSSVQGVLRGLHYQINHPQSKLVRVVQGEVYDVAVDLRPGSPTFGKWEGVLLSAQSNRQFFIPRGFAHGFYVLSETATFAYKCDDVYHPNDEGGLMWNDPSIAVEWPLLADAPLILSDKDQHHPSLDQRLADGTLSR